jgi:hypothetical protein
MLHVRLRRYNSRLSRVTGVRERGYHLKFHGRNRRNPTGSSTKLLWVYAQLLHARK